MPNDPTGRVLQLLSLLQTHRLWRGGELAERLEVTERTLRRDIDRLRSLGYSVDAVPGRDGGYRLANGAHLPPLLLEDDEAVAIAVGLRVVAAAAIRDIEDTALRALTKLHHVLPDPLRRRTEAVASALTATEWEDDESAAVAVEALALLGQACRDAEEIRFEYRRRDDETSSRLVEPRTVVARGRRWYLIAYDVRRDDWRTFRLDRMSELRLAGRRVEPRPIPGGDPAAFVQRSIDSMPRPATATVWFDDDRATVAERLPWLADRLDQRDGVTCVEVAAERDDQLVARIASMARWTSFRVDADPDVHAELTALADRIRTAAG